MRKGIQILLIISISFFTALFPAYLNYNYLIEADFPSCDPIFQNLDDENLLVEEQSQSVVFDPWNLSSLRGTSFLERLPYFSSQRSPLNQKTIVYRC
jgi:hypothetical protein